MEALLSPSRLQDQHESNLELQGDPSFPVLVPQRQAPINVLGDEPDVPMESDPAFPNFLETNKFNERTESLIETDPSFPDLITTRDRVKDTDTLQEDLSFPDLERKDNPQKLLDNDDYNDSFQNDPSFPTLSKKTIPNTFQNDPSFPVLSRVSKENIHLERDPYFPILTSQNLTNSPKDKTADFVHDMASSFTYSQGIIPSTSRVVDISPFTAKTFSGKPINIYRKLPKKSRIPDDSSRTEVSKRTVSLATERPVWKIIAEHEERKKQKEQPVPETPRTVSINDSVPVETKLLSDLYKPKKFIQLMGDERVNRSAMGWLKEWDQCVFKRSSLKRKRQREAMLSGNEPIINTDPLGRPEEKILLLSGPPGLGKTTMAHVIAAQSGYQVLEINASDERSSHVVTTKIKEAVESDQVSLTGVSTNKPMCVVIDEIDGSTGGDQGFIRSLIQLAEQGGSVRQANAKSKKKEYRPLSRPIICICNDLYAPVLRPLRPYCKIVRVRPVPINHVVKRMKEICESEKIPCDAKGLTLLVELAEGDFRTCLNTLQFIKSKGGRIDEKTLKSSDIAGKDSGTSPASVWQRLFKPTVKESNGERYIGRLARDVATCGEYDRLAQGCFENYLAMKPPNDPFKAIQKGLRWLNAFDVLETRLKADRNFELAGYLPYTFVGWNPLFANVSNKSIEWPKADYENYLRQTAHTEIADEFAQRIPAETKKLFSSSTIVTEMIPLMLRVLSPNLRSVNNEIVKANEKALLAKVVSIMSTLGVKFVPDRNEEGQSLYRVDPSIDVFGHYEGKLSPDLTKSRFSVRQLIAKELARVSMKMKSHEKDSIISDENNPDVSKNKTLNDGPAVDFFGRPIIVCNDEEAVDNTRPTKRLRVLYKYHEGFSNAVKVPMKISNLFG